MDLVALRQACESIHDWWRVGPEELERLAKCGLGARENGWLRKGAEWAFVGSQKFGAPARSLDVELLELAKDAGQLRGLSRTDSVLLAAAFYHVRFENIHPMHDGNGRIGRILMAGQIYQSCQISPALFEQHLVARQIDYRMAFEAGASQVIFRQLLLLLGRITQTRIVDAELPAGFSLEPLQRTTGDPRGCGRRSDLTLQPGQRRR